MCKNPIIPICILVFCFFPTAIYPNNSIFEVPTISQEQQTEYEKYLNIATTALDQNKLEDVRKLAKKVLKINKNSAAAYLLLAWGEYRELNEDGAYKNARKVIELEPDNGEAYYLAGLVLLQTDKREKATKLIEEGIEKAPQCVSLHLSKASLIIGSRDKENGETSTGRIEKAIEYLTKALSRLRPNDKSIKVVETVITGLTNNLEFRGNANNPSYVLPKALNLPIPSYTEKARSAKVNGAVGLGIIVNEKGDVIYAQPLRFLGYGLDQSAIQVSRKIKFLPARKADQAVIYWLRVEVHYQIYSYVFGLPN